MQEKLRRTDRACEGDRLGSGIFVLDREEFRGQSDVGLNVHKRYGRGLALRVMNIPLVQRHRMFVKNQRDRAGVIGCGIGVFLGNRNADRARILFDGLDDSSLGEHNLWLKKKGNWVAVCAEISFVFQFFIIVRQLARISDNTQRNGGFVF